MRRVHRKFLESCRNLKEGRDYWSQAGPIRRWVLQTISGVPLLAMDEDGTRVLGCLTWLETHSGKRQIDQDVIRHYHRMLFEKKTDSAGRYRNQAATVLGSSVRRPAPEKISALMKQLELKVAEEQKEFDASSLPDQDLVLRSAVSLHQRLVFIHPFDDGNGRVARLAMNHFLRRYGAGYVILPPLSESPEHFTALEDGHCGRLDALIELAKKHLYRV